MFSHKITRDLVNFPCLSNAKRKMKSDRCMKLSKTDIKSFSEEQENVNTKKKTLYDLKLFEKWRELREIPASELQQFMIKFVQGV